MRIVQERQGNELYVDLLVTKKEMELMEEFMVLSKPTLFFDKLVYLGIKLELETDPKEDEF